MSAEDLENYETERELRLYREYRDVPRERSEPTGSRSLAPADRTAAPVTTAGPQTTAEVGR